ncbi:hypothetical protein [Kineococcus esterisolvens]|uniref:hypothetical protein n=1 Tax=unclassified Kineococcus TaxID=2621656 RepID=UPI003D7E4237
MAQMPGDFNRVTVEGHYAPFSDGLLNGTITFTPSITDMVSNTTGTIILANPIVSKVIEGEVYNSTGTGPLRLYATDDPDVDKQGWYYTVTERFEGNVTNRPPYKINVPIAAAETGLNLWKVAPATPPPDETVTYPTLVAFAELDRRVAALEEGGGASGESAYDIAVRNGFVGTEAEWLASLEGADGAPGEPGADGQDGADGAPGADGADGESAYDIAVRHGFWGSEEDWLAQLEASGGVTEHAQLTGLDAPDSHPISAITGLGSMLARKVDKGEMRPVTLVPANLDDYATKAQLAAMPTLLVLGPDDPVPADTPDNTVILRPAE